MNQDAPVIASNCAAFREVAGPAAYFFDCGNSDELSDLLTAAGNDQLLDREGRRELGRQQAAKFTWENTAATTIDVYRSVLSDQQRHVA